MEAILIARLKNQDKNAIAQLYDMYSANLYGVILRIVKDEVVAQDVLQDCFVKIWLSFPQYDSDKGRLYTWIGSIARHLALDRLRSSSYRQSCRNQPIDNFYTNDFIQVSTFKPEYIGVKEFTDTLSLNHKKIVDLLYFEGYSQMEAAKVLNIPLGTVKTRVRQALQILRKLLVEPKALAA